ncbi:MAG: hypothetical protein Q4G23_02880, partial [Clostridia bacterium]|nr:hypothetical protein [Clostridia bacterium]
MGILNKIGDMIFGPEEYVDEPDMEEENAGAEKKEEAPRGEKRDFFSHREDTRRDEDRDFFRSGGKKSKV